MRILVVAFGWRNTMLVSAAITFIICAAVWVIVRDHPAEKGYTGYTDSNAVTEANSRPHIFSGIVEVLRYPNTWLLFVIPGGLVGCVLTFGGLWGVPYLITHHDLPATRAAALNSTLLVAWAIGGPVFGGLSDRIGRRKPLYFLGCVLSVIGWIVILFLPHLPVFLLAILLVVLSGRVIALRASTETLFGGGRGDDPLDLAIRVQANFVEYVPVAVLLLVVLEMSGTSDGWLHALGAGVLVGRILHAVGLSGSGGTSFGRLAGTLLTLLSLLGGAVLALLEVFSG